MIIDAQDQKRLRDILKGVEFFKRLKIGQIEDLIKNLEKVTFKKGSDIIKEGTEGNTFYIISKGRVSAWQKKGLLKKTFLSELGPNEFFGEMALLSTGERTATVVAEDDCVLFKLYRNDFKKIMKSNPDMEKAVYEALERRRNRSERKKNEN